MVFIKELITKTNYILREYGLWHLIQNPFYKIKLIFYVWYFKKKVKKMNRNYTLESLINFSKESCEGLIRPQQIKSEILSLLRILKQVRPKYILEIGTADGGTLFLYTRIATKDAILISIDLPGGKYGGDIRIGKSPFINPLLYPIKKLF